MRDKSRDKSREGVGWAIVTLLFGIGAAESPHPLAKLLCSLGAIRAGTKTVDCFSSSAEIAYEQLAAPREYHPLPSYTRWVKVSKGSSEPSQEIHPALIAKRVGKLDLLRDSN